MVAVSAPGRASSELPHWWRARWKAIAVAALLAVSQRGPSQQDASDRDTLLRRELGQRELLLADPSEPPHWIDRAGSSCTSGGTRVALRAKRSESGPHDIYLARAELSPEGRLLRLCSAHNLTQTAVADEVALRGDGPRLTWQLRAQGQTYRVEYADLRGEAAPSEFGALARWQWRLTQLERTGQWRGVLRRSFRLEPGRSGIEPSWTAAGLELRDGARRLEIPTEGEEEQLGTRQLGAAALVEEPRTPALPGNLLTWAVDRARALPWLGSEGVQWVKAIAFGAFDRVEAAVGRAAPDVLTDATDDVPQAAPGVARPPTESVRDPEFPPPPISPSWEPPLPGEGTWRSLDGDPFVKTHSGLPAPFATTFIRPDPRRETARVLVVIWDPRRIELHFMAGTEEPQSATGEVSPGLIPRDPAILSRLVGAFNGGFQTTHGAFGAQVSRQLLVPPRPYAATVVRYDDGAVGFGTWPLDTRVPAGIDSFRQNLTPLVAAGELNPYRRQWWGGVPLGWTDVTRTVRSALCVTRQNHVAYFYGSRVDHEALGRALLMAQCEYGIHLDMNAGHTGFEFYSVLPATAAPLPREELATRWKAEGFVPDVPELRYRARRLFRNMQLMHFPRYIRRQSRDFFYLTERALLPPAPLPAARDETGAWRTLVPGDGTFPAVVTTTSLRPDPARPDAVRLLELDLKWVVPEIGAAFPAPRASALSVALPAEAPGARALWIANRRAGIGTPAPGAHVVAHEVAPGLARAAWGLREAQIVVYAEVSAGTELGRAAALLDAALAQAGAHERLLAAAPAFTLVGGNTDLAGRGLDSAELPRFEQPALHFLRDAWQAQRAPFAGTEIVGPETWQPYQP